MLSCHELPLALVFLGSLVTLGRRVFPVEKRGCIAGPVRHFSKDAVIMGGPCPSFWDGLSGTPALV